MFFNEIRELKLNYRSVANTSAAIQKTANSAIEATLLFRALELWMNLNIARTKDCLQRSMCVGNSNIINVNVTNSTDHDVALHRMYAEIAR